MLDSNILYNAHQELCKYIFIQFCWFTEIIWPKCIVTNATVIIYLRWVHHIPDTYLGQDNFQSYLNVLCFVVYLYKENNIDFYYLKVIKIRLELPWGHAICEITPKWNCSTLYRTDQHCTGLLIHTVQNWTALYGVLIYTVQHRTAL